MLGKIIKIKLKQINNGEDIYFQVNISDLNKRCHHIQVSFTMKFYQFVDNSRHRHYLPNFW